MSEHGITYDRNNPDLNKTPLGEQTDQAKVHIALSPEERAKGFVRPIRKTYVHVGVERKYPLRDLTFEEKQRYGSVGYVQFEEYPEGSPEKKRGLHGRYWKQQELDFSCGGVTTMSSDALAETYARQPTFYGATYCVKCKKYAQVEEFVWQVDGERVGS